MGVASFEKVFLGVMAPCYLMPLTIFCLDDDGLEVILALIDILLVYESACKVFSTFCEL
jgi:hypothetical protein